MDTLAHSYADQLVKKTLVSEITRLSGLLTGKSKENFDRIVAKDPVAKMDDENLRTMVNLLGRSVPEHRQEV